MSTTHEEYLSHLREIFSLEPNPKWGLERTKELLSRLHLLPLPYKSVQVVGTNGKGSTVAFLDGILTANGIKTGRFTSPHLSSARERICLNGVMVSEELFNEAAEAVLPIARAMQEKPSFFECIFMMALWVFRKQDVDVAILEAGLGGRLDATTAVEADILGVTPIDLDHQKILGSTLEAITKEKMAAARKSQKVFIAPQHLSVRRQIEEEQHRIQFETTFSDNVACDLSLFGPHQKINAGLALSLAQNLDLSLNTEKNLQGLRNTSWPGRFEIFPHDNVDIILDGAHNEAGIIALSQALHAYSEEKPLILIYGSVDGHDTEAIIKKLLENFPLLNVFTYVSQNRRSRTHEEMASFFVKHGFSKNLIAPFIDLDEALDEARKKKANIIVTGSLYALGEIRLRLTDMPEDIYKAIY